MQAWLSPEKHLGGRSLPKWKQLALVATSRSVGPDGKISFDFGPEIMEQLRAAGVSLDGISNGGAMKIGMFDEPGHDLLDAADDCNVAAINKLIVNAKVDVNVRIPGAGTALMAAVNSACADRGPRPHQCRQPTSTRAFRETARP